ncbi:MAG: DUF1566 domain-containing protein [Desulfovibrio sp.]|nr:MAG: DUF1566 domain-containing protein [Desulfovibrio sp.]
MNNFRVFLVVGVMMVAAPLGALAEFTIPDTGQVLFYDDDSEISAPGPGDHFYGQDAHYQGPAMQYVDNGDGTVTDLVTGLMWVQDPGGKVTFEQGMAGAAQCSVGGYSDWRVPTIKEMYSLIDFSGYTGRTISSSAPFLDSSVFVFAYGDESAGERIIDAQFMTSTVYVSTTMWGQKTMFGVNFADGRIKGYGVYSRGRETPTFYLRYVRGGQGYGVNEFVDNGDGTVTDQASGLMWMQVDSGDMEGADGAMDWEEALEWAEASEYAGHTDWRLPNVKELQSIVDYTRSPDTTGSAAIDPIFTTTAITNPGGVRDFPYFWSSTTHVEEGNQGFASYVAFGRALGYMSEPGSGSQGQGGHPSSGPSRGPGGGSGPGQGREPSRGRAGGGIEGSFGGQGGAGGQGGPGAQGGEGFDQGNEGGELLDVHGAGCQRSDPKSGDPDDYEWGRGPQGDVIYIYNYVRLVRDAQ